MSRRSTLLLFASLAPCALGCGGPRTDADLHEAFARIQVEEARIENAEGSQITDCDERDAARIETCDAADDLCVVARGTDDRDALARCDRARARCEARMADDASRCGETR